VTGGLAQAAKIRSTSAKTTFTTLERLRSFARRGDLCYDPDPKDSTMRRLMPLIVAVLMLGAVFALPPAQQPAPQQQTQTKEQTVYATKTGKKYHRATCRYLSKSKIPMSLKDAKAQGLTACSVCKPPQ
jgi:hypothetical protein